MKKIFFILSCFLLTFTSCAKDNGETNSVLISNNISLIENSDFENKSSMLSEISLESVLGSYDSFSKYSPGFYIVEKNGLQGVVNIEGREIVPPIYEQILGIDDVIVVTEKFFNFEYSGFSETGMYSLNGELLLPCEYQYIDANFEGGMGAICKNDKWGAVNLLGKIILSTEYEDVRIVTYKEIQRILAFDENLPYWNEPTTAPYVNTSMQLSPLPDEYLIHYQYFDVDGKMIYNAPYYLRSSESCQDLYAENLIHFSSNPQIYALGENPTESFDINGKYFGTPVEEGLPLQWEVYEGYPIYTVTQYSESTNFVETD